MTTLSPELKSTSLFPVGDTPLPAELIDVAAEDCGHGIATQATDFTRDQMKIAQPLTPALDPNDGLYMPALKVGQLFIQNVFARDSVTAIFVDYVPCYIEWDQKQDRLRCSLSAKAKRGDPG
jgi:hypothetical protein